MVALVKKETWIDRILIDEKYQRQGIGRKAMRLLMFFVLDKYKVNTLYLSIVRENQVARKLYEELGFYYTLVDDLNGELIFKYSKGA
ncbi:GNAT family N-acetyltransferase [Staphylococcus nepalensis]|uniref:GNAT family N-acetyltransferase n=1 Tax=Staphylococcus nepalensis TaxID=214473 RepID=UPI00299A976B|nr:GNAT family N-acetyltransferase [Staphylococcus nepalensis]